MKAIIVSNNRVFGFDYFTRFYEILSQADLAKPFYSGKVANYEYKVIAGFQAGRMFRQGTEYVGIELSVVNLIAELENSTVRQIEVIMSPNWVDEVMFLLDNVSADLCAMTGQITRDFSTHPFLRFINTFDENAYCAVVPLPPRLTILHFLLTPFDNYSWILILVAIAAAAFVWQRLTRSFESTFYFIFFVIGGFFGQFVDFNVNRKILVIILQLFLLMTFILGNGYQSLIISTMAVSRDGIRLKTFDELFESDMTIWADEIFIMYKTWKDGQVPKITNYGKYFNLNEIVGKNIALIATCQQLNHFYYNEYDFDLALHFYVLPEQIMKFHEKMLFTPGSPFYDNWQLLYDRIFESGLRQHFYRLLKKAKQAQIKRDSAYIMDEKYMLTLDDVGPIVLVLLAGLGIATLVLIFEISIEKFKLLKKFRQAITTVKQCAVSTIKNLTNKNSIGVPSEQSQRGTFPANNIIHVS